MIQRLLINLSERLEKHAKRILDGVYKFSSDQKTSIGQFESKHWKDVRPVFVLSTGRTGTLLLTNLLKTSSRIYPVHEPRPELIRASKKAYEEITKSPESFTEAVKCAREDYLLTAALRKQIFVETNNRITFLAPAIKSAFPDAAFIHLVRHPADFVRSGARRNWYSGSHNHDFGRIVPIQGAIYSKWEKLSLVSKIAWLWNETNQFIETFKQTNPQDDFLFVKSEELYSDMNGIRAIFRFLEINDIDESKLGKLLKKPVNVQRKGSFPKYFDWSHEDKEALKTLTPLSGIYGYELD